MEEELELDNVQGLEGEQGIEDYDSYQAFLDDLDDEALTELEMLDQTFVDDDEELWNLAADEYAVDLHFEDPNLTPELNDLHNMFMPRLKSKGVNYEGVASEIKDYLASLPEEFRSKITVTSGMDSFGTHAKNSKHRNGRAVDLRYDETLHDYIAKTAGAAGLRTINPFHGTAPHTHLEVMQMGGFNIADASNPLANFMLSSVQTGINNVRSQSNVGGSVNGVAQGIGTLQGVASKVAEVKKNAGQFVFDTVNSGLDAAISILGQTKQNEELQRLQELRAEQNMLVTDPNPPIRNIPVFY
jgi:hypothetical protein